MLARNLPHGARLWAALDSPLAWTPAEHLAATAGDVLQLANWQRGGAKGPAPKPFPRPGDQSRADSKKAAIHARAARFAARQVDQPEEA